MRDCVEVRSLGQFLLSWIKLAARLSFFTGEMENGKKNTHYNIRWPFLSSHSRISAGSGVSVWGGLCCIQGETHILLDYNNSITNHELELYLFRCSQNQKYRPTLCGLWWRWRSCVVCSLSVTLASSSLIL